MTQGAGLRRADARLRVTALDLANARDPQSAPAALRAAGPCLIHAPIETAEQVLPMVPAGAQNTAMIGAAPVVASAASVTAAAGAARA